MPKADDGLTIEGSTVNHQIRGLVVDAAVGVDTAIVARADIIKRTCHLVRVAEQGRILHVANGAQPRDVLAQRPSHARSVVPVTVGQIDELAKHVGERFVNGACAVDDLGGAT